MKNKSVLLKKYFIVILSQIIVGIGASFLVTSGMGNDPMGVMVSGLSQKFVRHNEHYCQLYYISYSVDFLQKKNYPYNPYNGFCSRLVN